MEQFNAAANGAVLYVNCNQQRLSEQMSKTLLGRIDSLSAVIGDSRDSRSTKAQLLERAVTYAATQDFAAAISDLTAYVQLDSTSSLGYWQRAVCQSLSNEFNSAQGTDVKISVAKAIDDFKKAIELSPQNAYLYYDLGNADAAQGDYMNAESQYLKAVSVDHNLAEAYYNLGLTYLRQAKRSEAFSSLSKAGELGLYDAYSVIKRNAATDNKK